MELLSYTFVEGIDLRLLLTITGTINGMAMGNDTMWLVGRGG